MLVYRFLAIVAFVFVAVTQGVGAAPAVPIQVAKCLPQANPTDEYEPGFYPAGPFYWHSIYGNRYYQPPIAASLPTLLVDYTNVTQKTIKEVEFGLVARGNLIAEVKDVGTFSPGALIQHQFGLDPNVFPIGTQFARCVPLMVSYSDGSKWSNPRLPHYRARL